MQKKHPPDPLHSIGHSLGMQSYKLFEFSMVRNGRVPEQIVGRTRQREGADSLGTRYKGEEQTALCLSWENCRSPVHIFSLLDTQLVTEKGVARSVERTVSPP